MDFTANLARMLQVVPDTFRPRSRLPVSDWAEQNRILPGAKGGRWKNDRTPYLKDIMDALSETHPAKYVVFCKSVQIGGSEAGYNAIGCWMTESPANIILALPTEEMFRMVGKTRLRPMFRHCSIFTGKVSEARDGQGMTSSFFPFPGGDLHLVTAKSGAGVASVNARYVVMDETDLYDLAIPGEGSPVTLLEARTSTFGFNHKILLTSTPRRSFEESVIWRHYKRTDERKYFVPCPHCAFMQTLEWENLIYDPKKPLDARMRCANPKCRKMYDDSDKEKILPRGEWRATSPECLPDHIGFHLNSLYSPHGWISWGRLAAERTSAAEDPALVNAFNNTKLAMPFDHTANTPQVKVNECQVDLGTATMPEDIGYITAGIDTQTDHLHIHVIGWREGNRPFALDQQILEGDLSDAAFWDRAHLLLNSLRYKTPTGREMHIDVAAIDSGGDHTTAVYWFVDRVRKKSRSERAAYQIIAIKGHGGFNIPIISVGGMQSRRARAAKRNVEFHRVASDRLKFWWYRKLEAKELNVPKKWACGLPVKRAYFQEIVAHTEAKVPGAVGYKISYLPRARIRDENLDTAIYSAAALHYRQPRWDLVKIAHDNWQKKLAEKSKKGGKK